ncbi:MAG: hypothetical protein L3J52_06350, partial [Proteobacteria bacterium]|nr:hypothetical protein [Pseudomonadota bacterium]
YYIDKQPFSAQFYSSGKAINLSSKEIKSIAGVEAFVAVHKTNRAVIDAISDYSSVVFSNRNYILYKQN